MNKQEMHEEGLISEGHNEVVNLAVCYFDGSIDEESRNRLEKLLAESKDSRIVFNDLADQAMAIGEVAMACWM